jgi:hypothetical protein
VPFVMANLGASIGFHVNRENNRTVHVATGSIRSGSSWLVQHREPVLHDVYLRRELFQMLDHQKALSVGRNIVVRESLRNGRRHASAI